MIGGIAGYIRYNIKNCINKGEVINTLNGSVGGIAGYCCYGTIAMCQNTANITCTSKGDNNMGGIAGYLAQDGNITKCSNIVNITGAGKAVGGIVGRVSNETSTIEICYNTGNILGYDCIGGICGVCRGNIIQTYNSGSVGNNEKMSAQIIGGIIGSLCRSGTLEDSYNEGTVQGDTKVGGIVGLLTIENSLFPQVIRCYNNAEIMNTTSTTSTEQLIGSLVGVNTNGKIEGCYYNKKDTIKGVSKTEDVEGSFEGKTLEELSDKTTFVGWDFNTIWKIDNETPYLEFDF